MAHTVCTEEERHKLVCVYDEVYDGAYDEVYDGVPDCEGEGGGPVVGRQVHVDVRAGKKQLN